MVVVVGISENSKDLDEIQVAKDLVGAYARIIAKGFQLFKSEGKPATVNQVLIESENWVIKWGLRIFRKKALTLLISTSNFETIYVGLNCVYRGQFSWLLADQQWVAS